MIMRIDSLKDGETQIYDGGVKYVTVENNKPKKKDATELSKFMVPLYPISPEVMRAVGETIELAEKEENYICTIIVDDNNNIGILAI